MINIKTMLEESNIPVFRGHAPIGTKVPYMVYHVNYPDNLGADNVTYMKVPQYQVDLYQTTPNDLVRETIEAILTENEFYFTSDEADMEDQSLFITYYYFGGIK
jgi:hypothetical protein